MEDSMTAPLSLRPLARTAANIATVQAVIEAAPTYARLTTGAGPAPDAGASLFEALPPGKSYADKVVLAVCVGEACVGVVDLIRGYPSPESAMLGLLLIAESHHGRGVGRSAYEQVEHLARGWPGIERIRIGVVEANDRVMPFWRRMGFTPTGERKPYAEGTVSSRVVVLERTMEAHRPDVCRGGAA